MGEKVIEALSSGFGILPKIGSMFVQAFQTLFMNASTTGDVTTYSGLNDFGIVVLVFAGLSLAYGVVQFVSGFFRAKA